MHASSTHQNIRVQMRAKARLSMQLAHLTQKKTETN